MTTILPAVVMFLYFLTGLYHARDGRWDWVITWWGYALANIGLIWSSTRG